MAPKWLDRIRGVLRKDGWQNNFTGLGVLGKDKRLGSGYAADLIDQRSAEEVWRGDDIMARIVETLPNEMLREGFEVQVEDDKDLSEKMDAEMRRLDVVEIVRRGMYYGRALGGGGALLGADDGSKNLELPLAEDRIRTFDWLSVRTPIELQARGYFVNQLQPRYGEVALYQLVPFDVPPIGDGVKPVGADLKNTLSLPYIHESRILRFNGIQTTRGASLRNVHRGWDDSVMVRCLQVVNDFQAAWQGVMVMMADFAVPVLKIKGLARVLASQNANDQTIQNRARALEMCRSVARTAILDSEEEYKRETTSIAGLPEALDKLVLRLAASAQMPASLLMGQAPAGLNATGDSDIRWFYDQISAMQERFLRPLLMRICTLAFLSKSGPSGGKVPPNWDIKFKPLWQLTDAEIATQRYSVAQADAIYLTNQVATPAEIAKSRFGGDGYSMETQIDTDLRDELLDDGDLQLEHLGAAPEPDHTFDPQTGKPMPGTVVAAPPKPTLPPKKG